MKNKNRGITLISLVITIIIMLILAGVSLNLITGENSVLSKAETAVKETEKARIVEELQSMMLGYNMKVGNKESVTDFIRLKVGTYLDGMHVLSRDGDPFYVIEKDGYYFYIEQIGREYMVELMDTSLDDIRAGYTIVTEQIMASKENGSMKFDLNEGEKSTIIFFDKINNPFNFEVNGGVVNIHLTEDMMLTNEGMKRSAIKVASGATLNIYISEGAKITVNSDLGEDGVEATGLGAQGGPGGYAGINVPVGATLNIYGGGTLIAYGGDAGDGGGAVSGNTGGGGGGGAGAGIGGNGGRGGNAGSTFSFPGGIGELTNSGQDGLPGESCGTVNFHGTTEVFAYGGAGGSGGALNTSNNSGAGAGGYPAAGIGGGGAGGGGGEHACSAGGYSAGSGEESIRPGVNGHGSTAGGLRKGAGGGYYSKGSTASGIRAFFNQGGMWYGIDEQYYRDIAGSGGIAGEGGRVGYSDLTKIHAYNGDMITNGTHSSTHYVYDIEGNRGAVITERVTKPNGQTIIPAIIYAQTGVVREVYKSNQHMTADECTTYRVPLHLKGNAPINVQIIPRRNIATTIYGQGIGSGAGYIESSNGVLNQL